MTVESEAQNAVMKPFVELFVIDSGDSKSLYTTGREKVEFPGQVFVPAPIKRSDFSQDSAMSATTLTISAPPTEELTRYLPNYPIRPTTVTISRLFEGEDVAYELFFGRITSVSLDDNVATAECRSGSAILDAEVPRLVYSAMCQNDLFDAGCGLISAHYLTTAAVTVGSDGSLSATEFGAKPAGWFTGGYVVAGSDMRMIVLHSGDTLYLQVPFDASLVHDTTVVQAYPGCDGTPQTCKNKFNNVRPGSGKGFLGMPYIPESNPVLWGFK
jgi:hypothetical protein